MNNNKSPSKEKILQFNKKTKATCKINKNLVNKINLKTNCKKMPPESIHRLAITSLDDRITPETREKVEGIIKIIVKKIGVVLDGQETSPEEIQKIAEIRKQTAEQIAILADKSAESAEIKNTLESVRLSNFFKGKSRDPKFIAALDKAILDSNLIFTNRKAQYTEANETPEDLTTILTDTESPITKLINSNTDPKIQEELITMRNKIRAILNENEAIDLENMRERIQQLARTVEDEFKHSLIKQYLFDNETELSVKNEISHNSSIGSLLTIAMDKTIDRRIRFEAKRKISLMILLDHANNVINKEDKLQQFNTLLREKGIDTSSMYISSNEDHDKTEKIKGVQMIKILSAHDTNNDNKCVGYIEVTPDKTETVINFKNSAKAKDYILKTTDLSMRTCDIGNQVQAQINTRIKNSWDFVLKSLRKNGHNSTDKSDKLDENPIYTLKDINGIQIIIKGTKEDSQSFVEKLRTVFADEGVKIEDEKTHVGTDKNLSVNKFVLKLPQRQIEIEFQIFTIEEYLNYHHSKKESWQKYAIDRIFKSGVLAKFFPDSIYGLTSEKIKEAQENALRKIGLWPDPQFPKKNGFLRQAWDFVKKIFKS